MRIAEQSMIKYYNKNKRIYFYMEVHVKVEAQWRGFV